MQAFEFTSAADGTRIACVEWRARGKPRATVAIAHGAAEHGRRYARFAAALTAAGYATLAIDHRGHGRTGQLARLGVFADSDGWNRAVADLHRFIGIARTRTDRGSGTVPRMPTWAVWTHPPRSSRSSCARPSSAGPVTCT